MSGSSNSNSEFTGPFGATFPIDHEHGNMFMSMPTPMSPSSVHSMNQ